MSTREDREWDERQEYGYGNPLDGGFARMSAIIADRFGPDDEDCDPDDAHPQPVENPVYNSVVDDAGWDPLSE